MLDIASNIKDVKTDLSVRSRPIGVKLKRTFDMTMDGQTLKFWRVVSPANHPNYHSDLSLQGLRDWKIIP